jgi:hypothetical protein
VSQRKSAELLLAFYVLTPSGRCAHRCGQIIVLQAVLKLSSGR